MLWQPFVGLTPIKIESHEKQFEFSYLIFSKGVYLFQNRNISRFISLSCKYLCNPIILSCAEIPDVCASTKPCEKGTCIYSPELYPDPAYHCQCYAGYTGRQCSTGELTNFNQEWFTPRVIPGNTAVKK